MTPETLIRIMPCISLAINFIAVIICVWNRAYLWAGYWASAGSINAFVISLVGVR